MIPSYFDDPEAARRLKEEALSWIGTPFAKSYGSIDPSNNRDVKGIGGGIDCIGLTQEVLYRVDAVERFTFTRAAADYQSSQLGQKVLMWMRGHADNEQSKRLGKILVELKLPLEAKTLDLKMPSDFFKPGDILVNRSHGLFHLPLIYDDGMHFINALPRLGVIEGTIQDSSYRNYLVTAFRLKPKEAR